MAVKVVFKLAYPEYDLNMIKYFLEKPDTRQIIFKEHPDLSKFRKINNKVLKDYIIKYYKDHKKQLETKQKEFQKRWNKINDSFMSILTEVLEIKWPFNYKNIIGYVSVNPICPRHLKLHRFSVYYKERISMEKVVSHEILHFLYFEKWRKVFPESKQNEFEFPHLIWNLSEILTPVILNHTKLYKIIKDKPAYHKRYANFKFKNRSLNLIEHFDKMYINSLKKEESLSKFLKNAYKEVKILLRS